MKERATFVKDILNDGATSLRRQSLTMRKRLIKNERATLEIINELSLLFGEASVFRLRKHWVCFKSFLESKTLVWGL